MIQNFSDITGLPLSESGIDILSDDEDVFIRNFPIRSANFLYAYRGSQFEFKPFTCEHGECAIHEVSDGMASHHFGVLPFVDLVEPGPTRFPDIGEIALAEFVLNLATAPEQLSPLRFQSKALANRNLIEIGVLALARLPDCHLRRNSTSFASFDHDEMAGLVFAYAKQAYEFFGTKYGVLEFYRALEAIFLRIIFNRLEKKFFSDARAALKRASDSISKERLSLTAAVMELGQPPMMESIGLFFDQKKNEGNEFAKALDVEFRGDKEFKPEGVSERARAGIWKLYQTRCAIAHAGSQGIIYEDFLDADDISRELCPMLDELLLSALGFRVILSSQTPP